MQWHDYATDYLKKEEKDDDAISTVSTDIGDIEFSTAGGNIEDDFAMMDLWQTLRVATGSLKDSFHNI